MSVSTTELNRTVQVRLRLVPMYKGPARSGTIVTFERGTETNKKTQLKHTRLYTHADSVTSLFTCGKNIHKIVINSLMLSDLNLLLSFTCTYYNSFTNSAHMQKNVVFVHVQGQSLLE